MKPLFRFAGCFFVGLCTDPSSPKSRASRFSNAQARAHNMFSSQLTACGGITCLVMFGYGCCLHAVLLQFAHCRLCRRAVACEQIL
jgi:hypothetical protein